MNIKSALKVVAESKGNLCTTGVELLAAVRVILADSFTHKNFTKVDEVLGAGSSLNMASELARVAVAVTPRKLAANRNKFVGPVQGDKFDRMVATDDDGKARWEIIFDKQLEEINSRNAAVTRKPAAANKTDEQQIKSKTNALNRNVAALKGLGVGEAQVMAMVTLAFAAK